MKSTPFFLLRRSLWKLISSETIAASSSLLVQERSASFLTSWSFPFTSSTSGFAVVAVVGAGLSLLAWYGALRRLGTTRGIAYMYLVPVAATLLSWAFLGEAITPARLAGMAAVLLGVWLIRRNAAAPR